MARLTEEMVIARSRQSDLAAVKKLNCWGAELSDVSLLQRMPNVEVLALSLNKIKTLRDFASLPRLRELYVRKNEVGALSELRHLRRLPHLTALWLEENPCAARADYRHTVLRNLPRLTRLDDRPVLPDERDEALRRGVLYRLSDDEDDDDDDGDRDEGGGGGDDREHHRRQSGEWPPADDSEAASASAPAPASASTPAPASASTPYSQPLQPQEEIWSVASPPSGGADRPELALYRWTGSPPRRGGGGGGGGYSPDSDERYEHPAGALTRSYHERSSGSAYGGGAEEERGAGGGGMRHSVSAHSVRAGGCACACAPTNGDAARPPDLGSPPGYHHDAYYERPDRQEAMGGRGGCGAEGWERESERERPREFASAVMAEHRGFTRRPVTRNSNLLSAVLCLVKELDYASLEVAEMAVRCRMDELAQGP